MTGYKLLTGRFGTLEQQSWTKHCRVFHRSAQFLFTTSETKLEYCQQKKNVRVVSQVAKQLNTYHIRKLGHFKEIHEVLGCDSPYPTDHPKTKF